MIQRKSLTKGRTRCGLALLAFLNLCATGQTPHGPAAARAYTQRGKVKSISPTEIVLESVDIPVPQTFTLTDSTDSSFLHPGELVQVTYVVAGDLKLARSIAEIVATPVNLPRGATSLGIGSSSVNLPRGSARNGASTTTSVNLPTGASPGTTSSTAAVNLPTATAGPHTLATTPISLAADESQLIHLHGPEIHQSGIRAPIRIALLDLEPVSSGDLTPELATSISDRLASLLQNDALFTIVRDPALNALAVKTQDLPALAAKGIDAVMTGEMREDFPASGDTPAAPGQRRRIKAAAVPTLTLAIHLTDTRTGTVLGSIQGTGGGAEDRPDDHTPALNRSVRDAVESLASAIDPEYPELLDSRTFVTVTAVQPGHLTVTFPGAPTVQLGNRLIVSHPTWFTRDPATGHLIAVPADPLGMLTITNLEKSEVSGTFQGTPPLPGQTIRLTR